MTSTPANSLLEINALLCSFKTLETTLKCSVRVMGEMDKVEFLSIFDQITQYCYSNNNIGKMTINTMRVFILIIVSQADLKTISG